MENLGNKKVLVIAGPTGSGESSITKAIVEQYPYTVSRLVTMTTRAPRGGEQHGVDYLFSSKDDFLKMKEEGEILECTYVQSRDCYYGTYKPQLERQIAEYSVVIANTDAVGVRYYREHYGAVGIFIVPPDLDTIARRLRARNPDISEEELKKRLTHAEQEMAEERSSYDYEVLNTDGGFEEAVAEVFTIMRREGYQF